MIRRKKFMKKIEAGKVDWEVLKADLMELPKEKLVELIDIGEKNYWSCQSYWMTYVERDYGEDAAGRFLGSFAMVTDIMQFNQKVQPFNLRFGKIQF